MKRSVFVTGLFCGFAIIISNSFQASAASTHKGSCTLEFGGETYISGSCEIQPLKNGGFIIKGRNGYSAIVNKKGKGFGNASWSEVKGAKPTRSSLGDVWLHEGCWTNEVAVICAQQVAGASSNTFQQACSKNTETGKYIVDGPSYERKLRSLGYSGMLPYQILNFRKERSAGGGWVDGVCSLKVTS